MIDIYYHYSKTDGSYQGSGVTYYDDENVGSTIVEPPAFEQDPVTFDFITMPYFINGVWELRTVGN